MAGVENKPYLETDNTNNQLSDSIEYIDTEKIDSSLLKCKENCIKETNKFEAILKVTKLETTFNEPHDLDLAYNSKTDMYYIICDNVAYKEEISFTNLDANLKAIISYINYAEAFHLSSIGHEGYELVGTEDHRTMYKEAIGGYAAQEPLELNHNDFRDDENARIMYNNKGEDIYVFIQQVLGISIEDWNIKGVCTGKINLECKETLGTEATEEYKMVQSKIYENIKKDDPDYLGNRPLKENEVN